MTQPTEVEGIDELRESTLLGNKFHNLVMTLYQRGINPPLSVQGYA